jgi:hypothetical protein
MMQPAALTQLDNQTTRCSPLVRAHAPNIAEACKYRNSFHAFAAALLTLNRVK